MASGQGYWQQQKIILESRIRGLVNDDLKALCRAYGYQVSGTKIVLQRRCLEVLNDTIRKGEQADLDTLSYRIQHRGRDPPSAHGNYYVDPSTYSSYNMAPQRGGGGLPGNQLQLLANGKYFKPSPFYEILETLVQPHELPGTPDMPQNRHTVRAKVTIEPRIAEQFRKDNLKILLYCGEYQSVPPYSQANISFPNQVEIKVNESEVKSNFKGLKNKPGSTKPADLTTFIKKYKGEPNLIALTYALTTRKFCFVVYLVRHITPEKLTDRIKRHSVIRKQKVLDAMSRANADPDIAATSIRMSLKDPISTLRIMVPIRSSYCTHNQCFDGAMFMQLQEQAPQWSCPICTKTIPFDSLCVDEYFQEILDRTPITTEKVDIEPNGRWKIIKDENDDDEETAGDSNKRGRASYDDDFDDLVELDQPESKKVNGVKRESFQSQSSPFGGTPLPALNTPPVPSREASAPQSANKRPQSAVIDLTLSDEDEDDQPPRPAKRQHIHRTSYNSNTSNQSNRNTSYATPNSLPDNSRYQAQNRTQPQQPPQQDNSFRASNTHNQLPRPTFGQSSLQPSLSPPYRPSPPMQQQSNWSPIPQSSNFPRQSNTPTYSNINNTHSNTSMYPPPASPITLRPPPPPAPHAPREQRDSFYPPPSNAGYNTSNNSSYNASNSSYNASNHDPYNATNNGSYNSSYNANNRASWSPNPRAGQTQQSGLRLPPMNAASPHGQNAYQSGGGGWRGDGWRDDYDYGNGSWSQSPIG